LNKERPGLVQLGGFQKVNPMKNKTTLVGFATIATLAINLPLNASAGGKKKSSSPFPEASASPAAAAATASPAAKAPRAIPFHGMISAVDARAKTLTITSKEKSRTFKITDRTVLTKAGNPTTMRDVVADEEARGSYWKMADGTLEAKSVKLGSLTAQEKAEAKARRERRAEKKAKAAASPATSASARP
jgi:hypothetical protein